MNSFDDFIFSSKLDNKLSLLINKPKKIPPVLCFYGYPGNGKTSFAKYIADEVGADTTYFDMNKYGDVNQIAKLISKIESIASTTSI